MSDLELMSRRAAGTRTHRSVYVRATEDCIRVVTIALFALISSPAAVAAQDGDERLVVREVSFEGNRRIDDLTLRASIATTRSSLWERWGALRWTGFGDDRYFGETDFRRDVERLRFLYRRSGYWDVRIDTLVQRTETAVDVRFRITEGEPVLVTAIVVTGTEGVADPAKLLEELPLRVGDPFDRLQFFTAAETIAIAMRNRGYPFVEVFRAFDEQRAQRTASVAYEVVLGPTAVIDSVVVVGPVGIDEGLVRRQVGIRPGQAYSAEALLEAQRDLYRLGIFDFVDVSLLDSVYDDLADSTVTIRAQVSGTRLNRIQGGFGYGTLDCFRAVAGWSLSNFLGGGRRLEITTRLSKIGTGAPFGAGFQDTPLCQQISEPDNPEREQLNYNVTAGVRFPFVFSPRNIGSFSVTAERRSEVGAYLREAVGVTVSVTRETKTFDIPITVAYSLTRGRTDADPATFCVLLNLCNEEDRIAVASQNRVQSTLGLTAIRDRTNATLSPTRGNRAVLETRYSGALLGSDDLARFFKWSAEVSSYHRAGRYGVFAWRALFGSILSPRDALGGVHQKFVPIEERFYSGGPNSVRGFGQNELGSVVRVIEEITAPPGTNPDDLPKPDTIISATGGSRMMLANAEYRFRMPGFSGRLGGSVFLDVGGVFVGDSTRAVLSGLRIAPGFGVRVLTPLGPIRFDIAVKGTPEGGPLYREEGLDLILVDPAFDPAPGANLGFIAGILHPFRFTFAIGEAF